MRLSKKLKNIEKNSVNLYKNKTIDFLVIIMVIKLRLLNQYKKYEKNLDNKNKIKLKTGLSIHDLLNKLNINNEQQKLILVNGKNVDINYKLNDGDEVIISDYVIGG